MVGMDIYKKIKGYRVGKRKLWLNLFDYTRFGHWDENYFIPNGIAAIMGVGSLKL
jgi:hypothetical protein